MKHIKRLHSLHSVSFYWARRFFAFGCVVVGAAMTIYAIGAIMGLTSSLTASEGWSLALITVSLVLLGVVIIRERPTKDKI